MRKFLADLAKTPRNWTLKSWTFGVLLRNADGECPLTAVAKRRGVEAACLRPLWDGLGLQFAGEAHEVIKAADGDVDFAEDGQSFPVFDEVLHADLLTATGVAP